MDPILSIGSLKGRIDELADLRLSLKDKEETIQQLEIEISCLKGQVTQAVVQVMEELGSDDSDSDTLTFVGDNLEGSDFEPDVLIDDLDLDSDDC